MRKILKGLITVGVLLLSVFSIASCKKGGNNSSEKEISGISLDNQTYVYDGTSKELSIIGTLPEGVSASYVYKDSSNNVVNECRNAGTYAVECTLSGNNYKTLVLTATLIINNKTVTGVTLSDASYTYDGEAKTISLVGTLPAGTSAAYEYKDSSNNVVDTCIDAGLYSVTCTVSGEGYDTLTLGASLTISKANITGLSLESSSYDYDATAKILNVSGDIPSNSNVSYVYKNSKNEVVTECVLPDTYSVTATITNKNYNDVTLTATLTINKIDASAVSIDAQEKLYNGSAQVYDLTEISELYNVTLLGYYSDEALENIVTTENVKSGKYYVKLKISSDIYKETIIVAEFNIIKNNQSYHDVTFSYINGNVEYTGSYIAEPNEVITYDLLDTIIEDNDFPKLDSGSEYYFTSYNGEAITADTVISVGVRALHYTIAFKSESGETLQSVSLTPYSDLYFPIINLDENNIIAGWNYEGVIYGAGGGTRYNEEKNIDVYAVGVIDITAPLKYNYKIDNTAENNGVILTNFNDYDYKGELTLPEFIYASNVNVVYPVIEIGEYLYADNENITKIIFPENYSVKIGDGAFAGMVNLYTVVLPKDITKIEIEDGYNLFDNCFRLCEAIYTSNSNPLSAENTFGGLYDEVDYTVSSTVGSKIVVDGRMVYYIDGDHAVLVKYFAKEDYDEALEETLVLPETIAGKSSYILRKCFLNFQVFAEVKVMYSSITVSDSAFSGSEIGTIIIGNDVEIDAKNVFADTFGYGTTIGTIILGSGITVIEEGWFKDSYITTIFIYGNITDIKENAFNGTSITEIKYALPESEINPVIASGNDEYNSATITYNETI